MEALAGLICPRCEGPVSGVPLGCSPCNLTFGTALEVGPSFEKADAHAKLLLSLGLKLPVSNLDDLARLLSKSSVKAGIGQGHALLVQHQGTLSEQGIPTRLVLSPRPARGPSSAAAKDEAASNARWAWIAVAVFAVGAFFFFASQKSTGPSAADRLASEGKNSASKTPAEAIDAAQVTQSIISVRVTTHAGTSIGTGFAIAPGLFVTNRHVVAEAIGGKYEPKITFSGDKTAVVRVETVSDHTDLALLSCAEAECQAVPALPLRSPTDMLVGETVYAFGSPIGLELTMTRGILSHRARKISGIVYMQTDLAINPGNSGGPLLDSAGRVTGVVTLKIGGAEGIGFALPIDYYVDVVQDPALRKKLLSDFSVSAFRSEFVSMKDAARDLADEKPEARPPPPPSSPMPPRTRRTSGKTTEEEEEEFEPGQPRVLRAVLGSGAGRGPVLTLRFELEVEASVDLRKGVRLQLESEDGTVLDLGATTPAIRRASEEGLIHYRFDVEAPIPYDTRLNLQRSARLRVNGDRLSPAFRLTRS